jgi:hypothetical protein
VRLLTPMILSNLFQINLKASNNNVSQTKRGCTIWFTGKVALFSLKKCGKFESVNLHFRVFRSW